MLFSLILGCVDTSSTFLTQVAILCKFVQYLRCAPLHNKPHPFYFDLAAECWQSQEAADI